MEEEEEEVLEVAVRWEWEDFFKEVCQNYAQWEVKKCSLNCQGSFFFTFFQPSFY